MFVVTEDVKLKLNEVSFKEAQRKSKTFQTLVSDDSNEEET